MAPGDPNVAEALAPDKGSLGWASVPERPLRLSQQAVAEVEQDEPVTERVLDHRAPAYLDIERPLDQASTGTREPLRSDFGVLHEEVDLLCRMLRMDDKLGVGVWKSKPGLRRSSPLEPVAETFVEPDRSVQVVNRKPHAVDLPDQRLFSHRKNPTPAGEPRSRRRLAWDSVPE